MNAAKAIAALTAVMALVPAGAWAAPRVMSLDSCADQYVLALAPREAIVGLSHRAVAPDSYLRDQAAGLPLRRATFESLVSARPQVVVRLWGGDARRDGQRRGLGGGRLPAAGRGGVAEGALPVRQRRGARGAGLRRGAPARGPRARGPELAAQAAAVEGAAVHGDAALARGVDGRERDQQRARVRAAQHALRVEDAAEGR